MQFTIPSYESDALFTDEEEELRWWPEPERSYRNRVCKEYRYSRFDEDDEGNIW